ncbi:MAG: SH3 domain-containing protein [Bdellovibrionales bacterium]|nr:SH3 domain-containing protein [Bdellovibrionales bacterium]
MSARPLGRVIVILIFLTAGSLARALCVDAWEANLRKGPGGKYPVTWTVGKFTPLIKVDKSGGWTQVEDQDGEKHWVLSSLVTTAYQCVSVKEATANLRSGPGTTYPSLHYGSADKYTPFKRVDLKDDWYQVEDELGLRFWVHNSTVWRPVTVSRVGF